MSVVSSKKRVAVLRGGPSAEATLSMKNGGEILLALDRTNHAPLDVIITRSGEWLVHGIAKKPQEVLTNADVVMIALHGEYGEDGTVQREISRHGVPYVGARPYQSSIAMHKMLTKEHLRESGIKMAPHMRVTKSGVGDLHATSHMISTLFGPKYILKPMKGGSGIGIRTANTTLELAQALEEMFKEYEDVLVEQFIDGQSVTIGAVADFRAQSVYVTPSIEVILKDGETDIFAADKIVPGRFARSVKEELSESARQIHSTLDLGSFSRIDFVVTPDDEIYFLEANTLPAVTNDSPMMAGLEALGVSQEELILHLLKNAKV